MSSTLQHVYKSPNPFIVIGDSGIACSLSRTGRRWICDLNFSLETLLSRTSRTQENLTVLHVALRENGIRSYRWSTIRIPGYRLTPRCLHGMINMVGRPSTGRDSMARRLAATLVSKRLNSIGAQGKFLFVCVSETMPGTSQRHASSFGSHARRIVIVGNPFKFYQPLELIAAFYVVPAISLTRIRSLR